MMKAKTVLLIAKLVIVAIIVSFVVFAIKYAFSEETGYFILCNPGSRVNVRIRPEIDAPVEGWVEFGTFVHTDGKVKGKFVHVVDLNAEQPEGWIHSGYLVNDQPEKRTYRAIVISDYNLIARKCIGGKKIRVLHHGQEITVYAQSAEWTVTNKGFVMREWIEEDNSV